jgi:hypothetical protein
MSIITDGHGNNLRFRVLMNHNLLGSFKSFNQAVQFIKDNVYLTK